MASASLATGDETPPISLDGTPRPILTRNSFSPTKPVFDSNEAITLRLTKVIGTTTLSAYGFDSDAERSCFVTCAGSVAIWNEVDSDLNITQRFFRAHPSVTPQPATYESGTPTRSDRRKSQLSPVRPGTFGIRAAPTPSSPVTPTTGKSTARQGSRAAACVSLSQTGKLLAVGEVGHNPQVYLFSTVSESTLPLAVISEHSFGVKCVALSADARWLASVGDIHDGYIFVWALGNRIGSPRLQGSNKCITIVNAMAWIGQSVVTVGVRHVKVWRPDLTNAPSPIKSKFKYEFKESASTNPGPKALTGRNCILGSLLEANFTCIAAISDTLAVIGADTGDLCLLDDRSGNQTLVPFRKETFAISSICVDLASKEIWIAGANSQIRCVPFVEFEGASPVKVHRANKDLPTHSQSAADQAQIIGLALMKACVVALDSSKRLRFLPRRPEVSLELPLKEYQSHQGPVLGALRVPSMKDAYCFMTYNSAGDVMIWDHDGTLQAAHNIPLEQLPYEEAVEPNELTTVKLSASGKFIVAGDKYGILRLVVVEPWSPSTAIRSHQGDLNDITICGLAAGEVVATCGRDRTVQLYEYSSDQLSLFQTIDQHTGSVNCVLFHESGKFLLSASADRSVGIYALAMTQGSKAYLLLRILTLKQTPVALALPKDHENEVLVSTVDKQLLVYDLDSGQCLSSVKTADDKQTQPALLSSMIPWTYGTTAPTKRVLIGVSPTDKSIRVHDTETGLSLAREYGHSEGLSGIEVTRWGNSGEPLLGRLVTTGLDGTIMLWELLSTLRAGDQSSNSSPILESPAVAHPLRRVLSKSAFADFSRSLEADGMSPIPPSTPSRGNSPTRARNRLSMAATPTASPRLQTPRRRRFDRSPSPTTPNTPSQTPRKVPVRTRSVENFNSIDSAAEQLCRALKDFQRRAAATVSADKFGSSAIRELEVQLYATLESIGRTTKRHNSSVESGEVGELLGHYADRLARLVEHKVSLGTSGDTIEENSQDINETTNATPC